METTKQPLQRVTINTLGDYQRAAMRTMTPESNCLEYLTLGLVAEAGEVAGKLAKAIRDDKGEITEATRTAILYELGDCAWMVAGLKDFNRTKIAGDFESENHSFNSVRLERCITYLLEESVNVLYHSQLYEKIRVSSLVFLSEVIGGIALKLGSTLQEVMQMNTDKLTDRWNRGVIAGSGDNR